MKKLVVTLAAAIALCAPTFALAEMDHMNMDHGSMKMDHGGGMMAHGKVIHEEVVSGVKGTFTLLDIKSKMEKMGMKETHHLMVVFTDPKTKKKLSEGEVKFKIMGPDKSEQVKETMAMEGGFGADVTMPAKGKYGIMVRSKLADGKTRDFKFWYVVK
ncbi:hypothetical protein [Geomonas sp.]|uniref:hypothetical protein n=1 Tax=Geomonas sp. TaxID=2651584 RepID=UPI002B4742AD|nr:hypothetical protein [Geomonas sp.]HJV37125.1 hypothetical protein [Geomonas sp.]